MIMRRTSNTAAHPSLPTDGVELGGVGGRRSKLTSFHFTGFEESTEMATTHLKLLPEIVPEVYLLVMSLL